MDSVQGVVFFFIMLFFFYTPTKQSIHMYQQNRYQLQRYGTWLRAQIRYKRKDIIITCGCLLLSYGLFFVSHEDLPSILLLLTLMVYAYIFFRMEELKQYRKVLVFTHRVQRQFLFTYAGYGLGLLVAIPLLSLYAWIALVPLLYFLPWGLLFLSGALLKPVEKKIRESFVKDAKNILQEAAGLRIVGITGSYGKTSVKTILHTLLSDSFYTLMTPNSYNNQMGITLTIRNELQHLHEVFLCEMGADHVHEIEALMDFVKPQYGIVTAVGPQHLSTFHTMENILHEKLQMIEKLPAYGIGILNRDNAYIRAYTIQNTCTIRWYGTREECDYRIQHIRYTKRGSTFEIVHQQEVHAFSTKLLGDANIMNITAGVAMAQELGVAWDTLIAHVLSLEYVEHRLQVRESDAYTILDNAYNSNPMGAKSSLAVLKAMSGKRIIVTPGFLDLGREEKSAHIAFGKTIADSVDEAILVGVEQTKDIVVGLREAKFPLRHQHVVQGIEEAFTLLKTVADKDTTVLLENDLPDAFNH